MVGVTMRLLMRDAMHEAQLENIVGASVSGIESERGIGEC